ncbi:MAG: hypothetical protein U0324_31380 [Polyangiales bacterium]
MTTVTCICGCDLVGPRPPPACGRPACARALRANDLAAIREPDVSPEALAAFARSRSLLVRAAVARHPATPPEVLASLAGDDLRVAREVAANPGLDEAITRRLIGRRAFELNRVLTANPALSEADYAPLGAWHPRELARNPAWREHVAARPDHPAYRAGSRLVWRMLMSGVAPPAMVARAVASGTSRERELLATKPGPWLEALAEVDDAAVRLAVARNPACPEATLRALAEADDERLRAAAAFNPAAPEEVVRAEFAGEPHVVARWPRYPLRHRDVMHALAGDRRTTARVRWELLAHGDRLVRMRLAECPATPGAVLRALTWGRVDVGVMARVAAHPRAPADVLRRAADVEVRAVRAAVARNPATPRDVLERLAAVRHWSTHDAAWLARERLGALEARAARRGR